MRIRSNNVFGTTTDDPLAVGALTLSSAGLSNLAAVSGSDVATVTLDPNRVHGAPEIVYVTAHSGSATSATISRGQEGTAAREHPAGTFWVHAATTLDFPNAMCRVRHNTTQGVASGGTLALAFNTERYDTDSMHSTSVNNSRITFARPGVFAVAGHIEWASATDYTDLQLFIRVNGTAIIEFARNNNPGTTSGTRLQSVSTQWDFAAGDYVELVVSQANGAAASRNVVSTSPRSPEFMAAWLGRTA